MILTRSRRELDCPHGEAAVWRGEGGVLHVWGSSASARAFGLGWGHAHDRGLQVLVLRILGRAEMAWRLRDDPALIEQDSYILQRGLARGAERDVSQLSDTALGVLQAYCDGVNLRFAHPGRPLPLVLAGIDEEPWSPVDCMLVLRLLAYTSLVQAQEMVERFIVRSMHAGDPSDLACLQDAFTPFLDSVDPSLIAGGGGAPPVTLVPSLTDLDPLSAAAAPTFCGSNAWVLGPGSTASGSPLLANDPHLDAQNLPPAVYEVSMGGPDHGSVGVTVPGVPGLLAGRLGDIAIGLAYAFVDQIDFFVEECRGGRVRRGDEWQELEHRTELIRVKGREQPIEVEVWESDLGVLEGDPTVDGRLLCRAWTGHRGSLAPAVEVALELEAVGSTEEAMDVLSRMPLGFNYVIADRAGSIGLQQSGLAPRRPEGCSGLAPEPAWDLSRHWMGTVPPEELPRVLNPPEGFLVTANEALNRSDAPALVNAAIGDHRGRRIDELLRGVSRGDLDLARSIQGDLTSLRARETLEGIGHLLPSTPRGRALKRWDGVFRPGGSLPTLFLRLRAECLKAAFGELFERADTQPGPGEERLAEGLDLPEDAARLWVESTPLLAYPGFDRTMLDPHAAVWVGRDRESLLREAAARALAHRAPRIRRAQRVRRTWLLLEGSFLARLGFESSMVPVAGSGATPLQGRILRTAGRILALQPIWRMVADLGEDAAWTALAGGPSDRITSPWHRADLRRFDRLELKELLPPTE